MFDTQNFADIEEQCALYLAVETVGAAQGVLLGDPGNRERLARKSSQQYMVIGNLGFYVLINFVFAEQVKRQTPFFS